MDTHEESAIKNEALLVLIKNLKKQREAVEQDSRVISIELRDVVDYVKRLHSIIKKSASIELIDFVKKECDMFYDERGNFAHIWGREQWEEKND